MKSWFSNSGLSANSFMQEIKDYMGYILDLRKELGHRPLIMSGAGAVIINKDNRILLQKRADNGFWGLPAGSMELGESFEACARREVMEETGIPW